MGPTVMYLISGASFPLNIVYSLLQFFLHILIQFRHVLSFEGIRFVVCSSNRSQFDFYAFL